MKKEKIKGKTKILSVERLGIQEDLTAPGKKLKRRILIAILVIICFAIVFWLCTYFLNRLGAVATEAYMNGDVDASWLGSAPSYWGGIIGGVISGILACVGVFMTIRYYRESDDAKLRASEQPFLMISVVSKQANRGFTLGEVVEDKSKEKNINLKITNIGHGFAQTLVIHTGVGFGGVAYNEIYLVNEPQYIFLSCDSSRLSEGTSFSLQYVDSMRNEYIQNYKIHSGRGGLKIDSGYPQYIGKTHTTV